VKLKDIKKEIEKYYVIVDPYVTEVIFATLVGNLIIPRDPLWTLLVAPSSGGKSSLMAPCASVPNVHFVDTLSEKTFLSGYKAGKKEVSLLKIIGNGVMCFSDLSSLTSMNPISKNEILSQFRLIYDGTYKKQTGTGEISWSGKMGFLGAGTTDIYHQLEQNRSMGERFLFYSIKQPTDTDIVAKQESVNLSSKEIAEKLKPHYAEYMQNVKDFALKHNIPPLKMTADQRYRVDRSAIFCVSGKTSIHLDFKSGKPDAMPNRPGVGRDRKMFDTMLHSLQLQNCYEHDDPTLPVQDWMLDVTDHCAWSSINRERRKILEILTSTTDALTSTQIGATDNFGLQKEGVEKYIMPLFAVGLIKKQVNGNVHKWFIDNEDTIAFVKKVSDNTDPIEIPDEDDEMEKDFKNF
jgi:hypothetical protein